MKLRYSVDASSLIAAHDELYPPDVFPNFWPKLEALFDDGHARCIDEVKLEVKRKNEVLYKWCRLRGGMFAEISEEVQEATAEILAHPVHRRLTDTIKGRSRADPFIIAYARVHGLAVVSEEKPGGTKRIKIPDVCAALKVECITILGLMRKERWRI